MKIKTMPKETLAELLLFLAENEEFTAVEHQLLEGMSVAQVRAALRELAVGLRQEASEEGDSHYNPQKDSKLSSEAKEIISYLSPGEERALLQAFGLIDRAKPILKQ
ncbi:MAG: hypothetical protein HY609_01580 [Deltaproteobacteria bacterium]|nr:hypothetical protein [Deltaproteobacteria bacterium]